MLFGVFEGCLGGFSKGCCLVILLPLCGRFMVLVIVVCFYLIDVQVFVSLIRLVRISY